MYSKKNYSHRRRRRRLKPIPVIITALVFILIIGGIYFLLFGGKNKYEAYNSYNTDNKHYGTVEHYEKENDQFYISLYYPKVKEKNLNKMIKDSYNTYLKSEKKKKDQKDILYLDYSCKKIYKQYIVIELDYKRVNEDETKTKSTKQIMTYDCKTNQLLTLKDCLHGKYGALLDQLGVKKYDKESTAIKVGKKDFTYYTDKKLKNKVVVNYKKNKDYIKLANKNIPSNAPLDVKAPKLMKVDPKKKMVAITLDDGPHKTLTERAMNAFEKYNGRGTFFELGQNMNLYPNIVK